MHESLSMLVHGHAKVGKSTLAYTAPGPILGIDAEGGSKFLNIRKIPWDPIQGPPPEHDGTWDVCIVAMRDYATMDRVYQWLASGQHPFKSVVLDSISEIQQRAVDAIAGADQMRTQDWGELLRKMSKLVRNFRDLTTHPTNPLTSIVLVAMTKEVNSKQAPWLQGSLATTIPYYFDIIAYMFTQKTDEGAIVRRLLIDAHPEYEAGDRTGLCSVTPVLDEPNVAEMIDAIYENIDNNQGEISNG